MANSDFHEQIRSFIDGVLERDGQNLESVKSNLSSKTTLEGVEPVPGAPPRTESDMLEAIISLHRPVFAIANDKVDPQLTSNQTDVEETEMLKLVKDNAAVIDALTRSVGRIDLPGDVNFPWCGTGWIIDSELGSDIVVTNAHVAQIFAESAAAGYKFKALPFQARQEQPIVDFRHEIAET